MSPGQEPGQAPPAPLFAEGEGEVSVQIDLLRAELYRLLDELARSKIEDRQELYGEFEQSWALFKRALDSSTPHWDQ